MRICLVMCMLFPGFVYAQFSVDDFLKSHLEKLQNARTYTLAVIEVMPENSLDFKPISEEMTFKEQMIHLGQNLFWLSSTYIAEEVNPNTLSAETLNRRNKAELIQFVSSAYDYAIKSCLAVDRTQLAKKATFFAGPKNKIQILNLIQDHQTHHRAQAIVYLRLNGIKPPDYVGW